MRTHEFPTLEFVKSIKTILTPEVMLGFVGYEDQDLPNWRQMACLVLWTLALSLAMRPG